MSLSLGQCISIHAPLVGSDKGSLHGDGLAAKISIHAPLVGSDDLWETPITHLPEFQSTLPLWGATCGVLQ